MRVYPSGMQVSFLGERSCHVGACPYLHDSLYLNHNCSKLSVYLSCTHTGSPTFLPCSLFWQESNVLLVGRGHIVKVSKRCIHSKLMILTSTNILIWRLIEMWEWGHFCAKQLALTISISGPEEPYIVHYLIISFLCMCALILLCARLYDANTLVELALLYFTILCGLVVWSIETVIV